MYFGKDADLGVRRGTFGGVERNAVFGPITNICSCATYHPNLTIAAEAAQVVRLFRLPEPVPRVGVEDYKCRADEGRR